MKKIVLIVQLFIHLAEMSLENPCIAQRIAILEHLLEMVAAKSCFICHITDITFHIGGAGTKGKVQ